MRIDVLTAGVGLGILAAAPAQSLTQEEVESASDDVTSSTEIICRREPPPTGSRIGGRNICKTARQWAILKAEGYGALENVGNRNLAGNEGINSSACTGAKMGC